MPSSRQAAWACGCGPRRSIGPSRCCRSRACRWSSGCYANSWRLASPESPSSQDIAATSSASTSSASRTYVAAKIDFFEEIEPLGNVGALGRIPVERPLALLAFGDLVTDLDFAELVRRRASAGTDVLLASHVEEHRLQLGELVVEGERVVGYQEKPLKHFLICSGIGVMRREVLAAIPPDGTPTGLSDLITAALLRGHSIAHWQHGAFWMDVNSPEALALADQRVEELTVAHRRAMSPPS